MAVALAVINRDNSPLLIRAAPGKADDDASELRLHYALHSSLDVFEEKLNTSQHKDLYLGILLTTDEHRLYGYVTSTRLKIILMIDNACSTLKDTEMRAIFKKLHSAYCDVVANPFFVPGAPLESKRFDGVVSDVLKMGH